MIKVILLDDEETIIQGLKVLIDWNSLGFQIAGCGYDAEEGYEIIKNLKPEVLITDIRMPGISGLDLIDKVKTIIPNIKIIILSGYGEFDYARTALKKGVMNYLLKPIKKSELITTLLDIKGIIENEYKTKEKLNIIYPAAKHNYMHDLFYGNIKITSKNDINTSLLPINRQFSNFYISILEFNDEDFKVNSKKAVIGYIYNFLTNNNYGILFEDSNNTFILWIFMNLDISSKDNAIKKIHNILLDFNINKASIGVSSCSKDFSHIPDLLCEAKKSLEETFKYGKGVTIYYKLLNVSDKIPSSKLLNFKKAIVSSLESFDKNNCSTIIENLFKFMINDVNVSSDQIYIECINVFVYLKNMAMEYNIEKFVLYDYSYFKLNYLKSTYKLQNDLKNFLIHAVNNLIDNILMCPKTSSSILIENVKEYIKNNYSSVTRETAANYFHISPAYLSKLFRQVTNSSFIDFLTKTKMEEAKKMLINSPMQIQELSEKMGYSTSQYFSMVFENYTGFTPTKFRKNHMKGVN